MSAAFLEVIEAGPGLSVQDLGRPGLAALGLSAGGAADPLALIEAAALLGRGTGIAAIEMAGMGGRFRLSAPMRVALTGAPMTATANGAPLAWNAAHPLPAGAEIAIGGAREGVYGYLAFGGDIAEAPVMGSRSSHLTAGLGRLLASDDRIALGADPDPGRGAVRLPVDQRFKGGEVRAMPGPQTGLFSDDTRARFAGAEFRRDPRGNRQGVRLNHEGAGFAIDGGLSILSDLIVPGDIQMTGEGVPYVLLAECQTIGGYPRMGTVLPADLPRVAQCPPGGVLRIRMVSPEEAERSVQPPEAILRGLKGRVEPVLRNPHDIADLLAYQLVGGVTAGDELDQDEEQPR